MARNEIVVRPCVAFLHSFDEKTGYSVDPETSLIPRLDPREVASVFTVSFRNFLSIRDEKDPGKHSDDWYIGAWSDWHGYAWRSKFLSFFFFFFVHTAMLLGCFLFGI